MTALLAAAGVPTMALRAAGVTWLRYPDTTHAGYHWKECPGAKSATANISQS